MSLNFGQDNPRDLYNTFLEEIGHLKGEPKNLHIGRNAAKIASDLCDWVAIEDPDFNSIQDVRVRNRRFRQHVNETCHALNLLQDISNAAKHKEITFYEAAVKNTHIQGGFSRAFSNGFKQAGLYVEDDHGQKFLLDDLLEAARVYWDQKLTSLGL